MRVCNLSSGSDGNCTYVETTQAKILVDIGLSATEVTKRLRVLGVEAKDIDAILISHEHSDHIKGLDVFATKYKTKVYVHSKGVGAVYLKMRKLPASQIYSFDDLPFDIKDLTVDTVCLPHDAVHCSGFILSQSSRKISIITDLGHTNDVILNKISGSELVYLESNHDVEMLKKNPNYPLKLKARILGKNGHLSNLDCAKAVEYLVKTGTKQIMLSHISRHNNTQSLAYTSVCKYLSSVGIVEGRDIKISTTSINMSTIFKLN